MYYQLQNKKKFIVSFIAIDVKSVFLILSLSDRITLLYLIFASSSSLFGNTNNFQSYLSCLYKKHSKIPAMVFGKA